MKPVLARFLGSTTKQALPLPSQGLQMGWLPCPGLLCLFSWPLLGLDPSRRGPWTGVSSPKTGRMLAVPPMSCATASTETYGSEASSLVPLASLGATSWSILVTRSVSMPTTSPSAGLLGTPSHCRIWFLLAALEPASKRRCFCALHSLMGLGLKRSQ
uniref:tRNA splicing endonuclease subunit 34 n=1 Tax=Rousettus aegyptiacus TaxID=9407 RepID=A0A7J8CMX1_ROUAE|nr:tRNA splicing endonuclease subunit 34 [Rousettus aegyptiacus]